MSLIRPTWQPRVGTPARSPEVDRYLGLAPEREEEFSAVSSQPFASQRAYSPQEGVPEGRGAFDDAAEPPRNSFVSFLRNELNQLSGSFGMWGGEEEDSAREPRFRSKLGREQSFWDRWGGR